MDRIEFDKLRESLEAESLLISLFAEAVREKNWAAVHFLSQHPDVQEDARILTEIETGRLRVINAVVMVTGLCHQEAELKITQYCRFHQISWERFYELFTAGQTSIFPV